jgi:hypothetical protein
VSVNHQGCHNLPSPPDRLVSSGSLTSFLGSARASRTQAQPLPPKRPHGLRRSLRTRPQFCGTWCEKAASQFARRSERARCRPAAKRAYTVGCREEYGRRATRVACGVGGARDVQVGARHLKDICDRATDSATCSRPVAEPPTRQAELHSSTTAPLSLVSELERVPNHKYAHLQGFLMARPGLEPGTPRFSGDGRCT